MFALDPLTRREWFLRATCIELLSETFTTVLSPVGGHTSVVVLCGCQWLHFCKYVVVRCSPPSLSQSLPAFIWLSSCFWSVFCQWLETFSSYPTSSCKTHYCCNIQQQKGLFVKVFRNAQILQLLAKKLRYHIPVLCLGVKCGFFCCVTCKLRVLLMSKWNALYILFI